MEVVCELLQFTCFKKSHPSRTRWEQPHGAEMGTEVPLLRVKLKIPSFGNTQESLGAGWLLPHPELIPCPARLEFLLLHPICCDFIAIDSK